MTIAYFTDVNPTPQAGESLSENVDLVYTRLIDDLRFTDRLRFYAVSWLKENGKWPELLEQVRYCWHWFRTDADVSFKKHARIFPTTFNGHRSVNPDGGGYARGHQTFSASIWWFCSLWPRFYVDVVLPEQENKPADAESFWENLELCVPEKNGPIWFLSGNHHCIWSSRGRWQIEVPAGYFNIDKILHYRDDPHYRWTYGNAIRRAIEAWRGTE